VVVIRSGQSSKTVRSNLNLLAMGFVLNGSKGIFVMLIQPFICLVSTYYVLSKDCDIFCIDFTGLLGEDSHSKDQANNGEIAVVPMAMRKVQDDDMRTYTTKD
jgi:hypothetical protein